jgi:Endonuclease/Exonuclease/phosphatase family.
MTSLRLMTYNLRVAAPRDDEPSWAERRDAVASVIRFHDPDVVGVQEALPGMLDALDARLPDYDWVGTGRDAGADEHCALFFHTRRIDLADHDTSGSRRRPASPGAGAGTPPTRAS